MNPQTIIIAGAVVGLLLNTFAIFGIAWRGGHLLGRLEERMESIVHEQMRVVGQVDDLAKHMADLYRDLENRVGSLEGRGRRHDDP